MSEIKSRKTGLFFGSFNPVHAGHLIIANYIVQYSDLSEIWFVVSPQNPFKKRNSLLEDHNRLHLVNRAIENNNLLKASDIEFCMPKPSYTIDTLAFLAEKYPNSEFTIIMGSDNIINFHKWKNYLQILKHYNILVYPRPGSDKNPFENHPKVKIVDAPLMEISSSFIRIAIKEGKNMDYFLHDKVYDYIKEMHFYE